MTSPARAARPLSRPQPPRLTVVRGGSSARGGSPRRRRSGPTFVVASIIVFSSLLGATYLHGKLAEGQVHLDRVDQQIRDERAALAHERYELARLQTPQRIAAEAEAIGMVEADELHWLSPDATTSVTTGTDAAAEDEADDETDDQAPDGGVQTIDGTSDLASTRAAEAEA